MRPNDLKEELKRRKQNKLWVSKLRSSSWAEQLKLVDYRGVKRMCAVHGTRRTSKTSGVALRYLIRALTEPGYMGLFVSLTHKNVDRDFYNNCIKAFLQEIGYPMDDVPVSLPIKFPNGSFIDGFGADTSEDMSKKIRGSKWDDVCLDEVQSWKQDVQKIIFGDVRPTLGDKRGYLILLGTPGDIKNTFWHKVNTPDTTESKMFDLFNLHWSCNPYVSVQISEDIERWRLETPEFLEDPKFKREWEGLWEVEENLMCYRYTTSNLTFKELPGIPDDYWFVFGVDFGYTDQFAISVGAWPKRGQPTLYMVDVFAKSGMTPSKQGEKLREFYDKYRPMGVMADPSGAGDIEEFKTRFSIPVEKAQKNGKRQHMEFMNADLAGGRVQVLPEVAKKICPEWDVLVWDRKELEENFKWVETSKFNNHMSDATLYMYWGSRHYRTKPKDTADTMSRLGYEWFEKQFEERHMNPNKDQIDDFKRSLGSGTTPSSNSISAFRHRDSSLKGLFE